MAGAGPEFVGAALAALAADPEVDLIVSISGSSGRAAPERTVPPLAEAARGQKPVVAFLTPDAPESLRGLVAAGVPVFRTPETCADVVGAFCRWRAPRIRRLARRPAARRRPGARRSGVARPAGTGRGAGRRDGRDAGGRGARPAVSLSGRRQGPGRRRAAQDRGRRRSSPASTARRRWPRRDGASPGPSARAPASPSTGCSWRRWSRRCRKC